MIEAALFMVNEDAAIDPKVMEARGLSAGDVIEIIGKGKKSHTVLWTGYSEDYGRGLIRIDGYTRNNIGVGIDDTVGIAAAEGKAALEIVLAAPAIPLAKGVADWLARSRSSKLTIIGPDGATIVENISSRDAAGLAEKLRAGHGGP